MYTVLPDERGRGDAFNAFKGIWFVHYMGKFLLQKNAKAIFSFKSKAVKITGGKVCLPSK